jgi:hypothetical protein
MLITPWVFFRYMVVGVYVGVATVSAARLRAMLVLDLPPWIGLLQFTHVWTVVTSLFCAFACVEP